MCAVSRSAPDRTRLFPTPELQGEFAYRAFILAKIAAAATVVLVAVRALRPSIAKVRNALYGEHARPANPFRLSSISRSL